MNKTEEEQFFKELACLICCIYYSIQREVEQGNPLSVRVGFNDIVGLYAQVASLPLHSLLDVLDEMRTQLIVIITTYSAEGEEDEEYAWVAWLTKNWWVPPVFCISVFIECIRWYVGNKKHLPVVEEPELI